MEIYFPSKILKYTAKVLFNRALYHIVYIRTIDTTPTLTNEAAKAASSQKLRRVHALCALNFPHASLYYHP